MKRRVQVPTGLCRYDARADARLRPLTLLSLCACVCVAGISIRIPAGRVIDVAR